MIVRNDDHNTFDHVAHTLAGTLPGVSVDAGYRFADRIHNTGLAIVWSGHLEAAEHYWEQLVEAGLTMAPLEQGCDDRRDATRRRPRPRPVVSLV